MLNALLDKHQVAKLLNVSPRTVDRLRHQGLLQEVKIGTRVLFQPEAVAAFLAKTPKN